MGRMQDWPDGKIESAEEKYAEYDQWLARHGQSYGHLRDRIVERARSGGTITYGELMAEFTKVPSSGYRGIGTAVGLISELEKARGHPYLSAIVVAKGSTTSICPKGHPSGGFLGLNDAPTELYRETDRYDEAFTAQDQEYVARTQREVWDWWDQNAKRG